jgi:NADP-dependent 3-hydroxy acid dehydrogenase YdfG
MATITIVTGAASGIGAACAQSLCAAGVTVLGVDRDEIPWHAPTLQPIGARFSRPTFSVVIWHILTFAR